MSISLVDPNALERIEKEYRRKHRTDGLDPLYELKCVRMAPRLVEAVREFCRAFDKGCFVKEKIFFSTYADVKNEQVKITHRAELEQVKELELLLSEWDHLG